MPSVAAQLAQAAVPVVTVVALVLAFRTRRHATAREATLARAQWLTVAAAAVGLYLLAVTVLRLRAGNPYGVLTFIALCAYGAGAGTLVRMAWRRYRRLLQSETHARWEAASAAVARPRHTGLSGEEQPPARW